MPAGKYRQRITIQRSTNFMGDWEDVATVWADVRPISAREKVERASIEQNITHRMDIRYRGDIDSRMRVLYRGRIYQIEEILNPGERNAELSLLVEELHTLPDIVTVKRKERIKDERNVVTAIELLPRDVQACIVDVQYGYEQQGNDPVNWEKKATVDFELGEDVREGDTITLSAHGDFFVTQARPGKHFLQVVAIQERRGAE